MPLHDWSRVPSGLFHDFHQSWSIRIKDTLNRGLLPKGTVALVEPRTGAIVSDALAIERRRRSSRVADSNGGVATLSPSTTTIVHRSTNQIYATRANRILIKHHLGRIVAVIEIVSPGNKDSHAALKDFVGKTLEFLKAGIDVLVVDLFPPSPRDPLGIHPVIWEEIGDEPFAFPPGKDRTLVSYKMGEMQTAYIEPIAVGDSLRDMPLFLTTEMHVNVPLETTYQATWEANPEDLRTAVETGIMPNPDAE